MDNVSSVESSHTLLNVTAALANTELFRWFWVTLGTKDVRRGGKKSKEQKKQTRDDVN